MSTIKLLESRRSVYAISDVLPIDESELTDTVLNVIEFVPDAFNMKSQRIVLALGDKHKELWDRIYKAFDGKVSEKKIKEFKAGYGTALFFIDDDVLKKLQEQEPLYADNIPIWAEQSNGMMQFSVWTALSELKIGANLQHYNPIIDDKVRELFNLPKSYRLCAQMPFGGIIAIPCPKGNQEAAKRLIIAK